MRDQTSYGLGNIENVNKRGETYCVNEEVTVGQGPIGSIISQTPSRSETWMSLDNNIKSRSDCNSLPTGNPQLSNHGFSNILTNWYVNETDRGTVNPQNIEQVNLTRAGQMGKFYTYTDLPAITNKETTEYAYAGNASRGNDGETFYTYTDLPAVTNKETTEYAYSGAPSIGGFAEMNRSLFTGFDNE